jgi:formylmethanofuran dehydrogenase subunit B
MTNAVRESVSCPHCGCSCQVFAFADGCGLDRAAPPPDAPPALIDGRPVGLAEAIDRAATILKAARCPLIYGLASLTCESQRAAVALADRAGACVDVAGASPAPLFPDLGTISCTLGEMKNRADLIVFWGGQPDVTHPRLVRELAFGRVGRFVQTGWGTQSTIIVSSRTAAASFAALWFLRALVQGQAVDKNISPVGGAPFAEWQLIANRLRQCKYGVLIIDPAECGPRAVEAAHGLATDLQAVTRFSVLSVRPPGNGVGAEQVLTWQTGYPSAVGLHAGYPRSFGAEFGADRLLARGETDAALMVGINDMDNLSSAARAHLGRIPVIALSPQITSLPIPAKIAITTSICAAPGGSTAFRLDGVALPLRPTISTSFPDDFQVLQRVGQALV